jgi:serine/threonine protein kinase
MNNVKLLASESQEHYNMKEVDRFSTKYSLHKTINSGFMNAVATGINRYSYKKVIIKSIYKPYCFKLKEVSLLKKLINISGVINYYDHYYIKNDVHFLVMEYFGHMNLKHFLTNYSPISESTAHTILVQLIDTVHSCFLINILHRKLKSNNILINVKTLQIKVINFNSACQFDRKIFTSQLCKTIAPPRIFQT